MTTGKVGYSPAVIAVMFSFFLISLMSVETARALTVDRILATVGAEIITFAEYKQFAKGLDGQSGDDVDEALLRKLIEETIMIQEAKRKGFDSSDAEVDKMIEEFRADNGLSQADLEDFLNQEGLNTKTYRQALRGKVLLSKLISGDVDSKIIVRDEELREYYQENKREFVSCPEMVEVKAIFLRLREDATVTEITDLKLRALRITAMLEDGYNFDSLVDEYSDEPLKSQGGILGKFARGSLIPLLDDRAFSMEEGGTSGPIWVGEGVYIIRISGKSGETFKTFDEVKEEIYGSLYRQKREKAYNEWIKALWEKASVTINQR